MAGDGENGGLDPFGAIWRILKEVLDPIAKASPVLYNVMGGATAILMLAGMVRLVAESVWSLLPFVLFVLVVILAAWVLVWSLKFLHPGPGPAAPADDLPEENGPAEPEAGAAVRDAGDRAMAAPSPRRQAPLSLAVSVSALFSAFVYSLSLNASTVLGFFPGVEIALHERGLDRLLTASCMARLFQDCQVVRDQIAEQAPAAKPVALPPSPPALPSSVAPGDYEVYIQFAGTFTREQIVRVATVVRSRGWDVQGADQGGERTPAAAGRREVRYGPDEDEAAARALAAEFDALGLVAKPLAVKQFEIIPSHSLEVWISN